MFAGRGRALVAWILLLAGAVSAQDTQGTPGREPSEPDRPGRFRLGPFYLNPYFRIGNIGIDTNVLFTTAERKRDIMTSGGPGLDLVLPITRAVRLTTGGNVEYLYFAKQASQRRLTGGGRARFDWRGPRVLFGVEESYGRTFLRPEAEIDSRVAQGQWQTRVDLQLARGEGRIGVTTRLSATRIDPDAGQSFLGNDLTRNLTQEQRLAFLGIQYGLTVKTAFVVEGDFVQDRFALDPLRDADSDRIGAGFEVTSATRISGKAVVGARSIRWVNPRFQDGWTPYSQVEMRYRFTRDSIEGRYVRDVSYSAFNLSNTEPTARGESYEVKVDKGIVGRLNLLLVGRFSRFRTDSAVRVNVPTGAPIVAVRDDSSRAGSADLGYAVWPRLRIGFGVLYVDRLSTISYFGVRGLAMGLTVVYSGTPSVTLRP